MTEHRFETHQPVDLYVEIGKGNVHVFATDTTEATVTIAGRDADEVQVEQSGDQISVIAPRQRSGFLSGDSSLKVDVVLPFDSNVAVKTKAEELAARSGHSLNTWLVNIVRAATSGDSAVNVDIDLSSIPFFGGNDPFGKRGNRRMSGWI